MIEQGMIKKKHLKDYSKQEISIGTTKEL